VPDPSEMAYMSGQSHLDQSLNELVDETDPWWWTSIEKTRTPPHFDRPPLIRMIDLHDGTPFLGSDHHHGHLTSHSKIAFLRDNPHRRCNFCPGTRFQWYGHGVKIGVFYDFSPLYIYIYIGPPFLAIFRVFRDSGHGTKIGVFTKIPKRKIPVMAQPWILTRHDQVPWSNFLTNDRMTSESMMQSMSDGSRSKPWWWWC
jgi:hypothetical protein